MPSASRKLRVTLSTLKPGPVAVEPHSFNRAAPDRHRQKAGAEMKCGGIRDASLPRLLPHPLSR